MTRLQYRIAIRLFFILVKVIKKEKAKKKNGRLQVSDTDDILRDFGRGLIKQIS